MSESMTRTRSMIPGALVAATAALLAAAPAGASFTAVTLMVSVLADGSRSTPPFAVPPLSCTWKVNEA